LVSSRNGKGRGGADRTGCKHEVNKRLPKDQAPKRSRTPSAQGHGVTTRPRGQTTDARQWPGGCEPSSLLEGTVRPDSRAAENNLERSTAACLRKAKAAYFPRLFLTGFLLGFQRQSAVEPFTGSQRAWSFRPTYDATDIYYCWPAQIKLNLQGATGISAGFNINNDIRQACREVSDALWQYRKVKGFAVQQDCW